MISKSLLTLLPWLKEHKGIIDTTSIVAAGERNIQSTPTSKVKWRMKFCPFKFISKSFCIQRQLTRNWFHLLGSSAVNVDNLPFSHCCEMIHYVYVLLFFLLFEIGNVRKFNCVHLVLNSFSELAISGNASSYSQITWFYY